MNPAVSIITPVHNGEEYLAESINSILEQTHEEWELLIVNDGSTDGSVDVVESYDDERIRLFSISHSGVSIARNKALDIMKGEYFCFLDADDRLTPNSLEIRLRKFKENPELEFVDGPVNIFSVNSSFDEVWRPKFKGKPLDHLLRIDPSCFFGSTWMFRKSPDRTYRFKEGLTHGEDLLFNISVARYGGLYSHVNEPVYQCRRGHNSAMTDLRKLEAGYAKIARELAEMAIDKGKVKKFKSKTRSIIWKSYLANYQPIRALKSLYN